MSKLTILSFGGGQDSTTILLKLVHDKDFRAKYVKEDLAIIMSDTGNEHPHTYKHVEKMKRLSEKNGIPFFLLTADMGYHTEAWSDLIEPQVRSNGDKFKKTLVQLGTKTCTHHLKIDPIYKFVDAYVNKTYNMDFEVRANGGCNKKALKEFFAQYGQIDVLIGFAAGEESRMIKSVKLQDKEQLDYQTAISNGKSGSWHHIINRVFPLIEEDLNRDACIEYIESKLQDEVMPSNCMLCPYQSPAELLWLHKNYPEQWDLWVSIEADKISRYAHLEGTEVNGKQFKNHGVYNTKKLLSEKLEDAKLKFGHLTDAELHQYKKSHGCQTNSI